VPIGIGVAFLVAFGWMGYTYAKYSSVNPMPLVIAAFVAFIGPMELRALRYREWQKRQAQHAQAYALAAEPLPYTPLPYPDEEASWSPSPAAPPATPAPLQPGFTGYTWDREFGVWVKWQNGRRVAAFWNGSE
jgi:hypothetical protein